MFLRSRGLRRRAQAFKFGTRKVWGQPEEIGTVLALGALAGLRSLLPQALIARALRERAVRLPAPFDRVPTEPVTRALAGAALMELVSDPISGAPRHIRPLALLGRILSGGIAGFLAIASTRRRSLLGTFGGHDGPLFFAIGAGAAALTTLGSHHARGVSLRRLGGPALWGALEHGLTVLATRAVMRRLGH